MPAQSHPRRDPSHRLGLGREELRSAAEGVPRPVGPVRKGLHCLRSPISEVIRHGRQFVNLERVLWPPKLYCAPSLELLVSILYYKGT